MKTFIIFLIISFQIKIVSAQVFTGTGVRYSIGSESGITVGHLAKKYGAPLGLTLQAEFPILDGLLFGTVNAGFNNIFARPKYRNRADDLRLVPFKAGLKYFYTSNLYVQGEMGFSYLLNKAECVEGKNAALVYAPQAGIIFYLHDKNYLDAGLRFESNGKFYKCDGQNNHMGFRLAWAFTL